MNLHELAWKTNLKVKAESARRKKKIHKVQNNKITAKEKKMWMFESMSVLKEFR